MKKNYLTAMSKEWFIATRSGKSKFSNNKPYPNLYLSKIFSDQFLNELMTQFPPFDLGDVKNEMGGIGRKSAHTDLKSLGGAYEQLDNIISSDDFLNDLSKITGFDNLLYDPYYYGGGTHENMNSQNMATHIDYNYHPLTGTHRRVNIIIYLNERWDDKWGGLLQLHSNPWNGKNDVFETVPCLKNNTIIFETSEHSWHGFSVVKTPRHLNISRRSIALYFYTKDRPTNEVAPSHGTIYVEPYLDKTFLSKNNIDYSDYHYVLSLFNRHQSYIEYLIDRDKKFTNDLVEKLIISLSLKRFDSTTILSIVDDFLQTQKGIMYGYYEKEKLISSFQNRLKVLNDSTKEKESILNTFFWGKKVIINSFTGVYDDRWMEPSVTFDISLLNLKVSNIVMHIITPDDDQTTLDCEIILNNVIHKNISWYSSNPGKTTLTIFNIDNLFPLKVQINFSHNWVPKLIGRGDDERQLSYLLDGIDVN